MMITFLFWMAGLLTVASAVLAVTRESPIYAALFTMTAMAGVAGEFVLLHSPFLGAMEVLLYAGAIMVLFVFVIMLLSLKKEEHGEEPPATTKLFGAFVSIGTFMMLVYGITGFTGWTSPRTFTDTDASLGSMPGPVAEFGSTEHFGHFLYGTSLVPFELVSVLIMAAIAGVVLLARKRVMLGREDRPVAEPSHDGSHGGAGHS
jgi:NADH-quinone oxidoreductase subunit J